MARTEATVNFLLQNGFGKQLLIPKAMWEAVTSIRIESYFKVKQRLKRLKIQTNTVQKDPPLNAHKYETKCPHSLNTEIWSPKALNSFIQQIFTRSMFCTRHYLCRMERQW